MLQNSLLVFFNLRKSVSIVVQHTEFWPFKCSSGLISKVNLPFTAQKGGNSGHLGNSQFIQIVPFVYSSSIQCGHNWLLPATHPIAKNISSSSSCRPPSPTHLTNHKTKTKSIQKRLQIAKNISSFRHKMCVQFKEFRQDRNVLHSYRRVVKCSPGFIFNLHLRLESVSLSVKEGRLSFIK